MAKAPEAFRTISEVSAWLDTPAHVLRFWESKFTQVRPVKRAGGRRYYRPEDVALLGAIKALLHEQGMTIKGVQKMLREQGAKEIAARGPAPDWALPDEGEMTEAEQAPAPEQDLPAALPDERSTYLPTAMPTAMPTEAEQAAMAFSFASARHEDAPGRSTLLARIHRADKDHLRSQTAKLTPLVARLTALRDRLEQAAAS